MLLYSEEEEETDEAESAYYFSSVISDLCWFEVCCDFSFIPDDRIEYYLLNSDVISDLAS